jgi:hypothetical protein
MAALNMRNTMRRRWTAPPPSGRSFSVHLTANPNDEVMLSPTEYALKELQSPIEVVSSVSRPWRRLSPLLTGAVEGLACHSPSLTSSFFSYYLSEDLG